ncbi:MAG: helix-turn-helix transcriptional regulator [Bacteroidales bacterium]|nr:helix-turn-helix transcriptional regulator [Bacteroidales bacterium]
MNLKELGNRIEKLRRERNLTQENVAFDLNISNTAYSKIERGETNVSFTRLTQIAGYFKIELADLLKEKPSPFNPTDIKQIAKDIEQIKTDISKIQRAFASAI